jgi:hypothetical protein
MINPIQSVDGHGTQNNQHLFQPIDGGLHHDHIIQVGQVAPNHMQLFGAQ